MKINASVSIITAPILKALLKYFGQGVSSQRLLIFS